MFRARARKESSILVSTRTAGATTSSAPSHTRSRADERLKAVHEARVRRPHRASAGGSPPGVGADAQLLGVELGLVEDDVGRGGVGGNFFDGFGADDG